MFKVLLIKGGALFLVLQLSGASYDVLIDACVTAALHVNEHLIQTELPLDVSRSEHLRIAAVFVSAREHL